MPTALRPSLLVLALWLAVSSAPTDSTGRGQTFSCSHEPDPIHLSTNDPKRLYEEDFKMPMGVRYWGLTGVRYRTPGDSSTAQALNGRIIFESDDESFGLMANDGQANAEGQPETQRYWVHYPSYVEGGGLRFAGVPIEVVEKAATADTLGLLLRGTDGALEHEYRIHISGRLGRGSFEHLERRGSGPWLLRLRYDMTK